MSTKKFRFDVYKTTSNKFVTQTEVLLPLWVPFLPCPLALSDSVSSKTVLKYTPTPPLPDRAICGCYHQRTLSDLPASALCFPPFLLILLSLAFALSPCGSPSPAVSSGVDKVQLWLWCPWQLSFCLHTSQALGEAMYHNTPCLFAFIWNSFKSLPNH